jgi:hypothetical protein
MASSWLDCNLIKLVAALFVVLLIPLISILMPTFLQVSSAYNYRRYLYVGYHNIKSRKQWLCFDFVKWLPVLSYQCGTHDNPGRDFARHIHLS